MPKVVVVTNYPGIGDTATHAEGDYILIKEGHLHVTGNGDPVAIYAPGKWSSAKVDKS
jgi:hypothetical protein